MAIRCEAGAAVLALLCGRSISPTAALFAVPPLHVLGTSHCPCRPTPPRSFGTFCFFALQLLLLLGVIRKSNPRLSIHTGWWPLKWVLRGSRHLTVHVRCRHPPSAARHPLPAACLCCMHSSLPVQSTPHLRCCPGSCCGRAPAPASSGCPPPLWTASARLHECSAASSSCCRCDAWVEFCWVVLVLTLKVGLEAGVTLLNCCSELLVISGPCAAHHPAGVHLRLQRVAAEPRPMCLGPGGQHRAAHLWRLYGHRLLVPRELAAHLCLSVDLCTLAALVHLQHCVARGCN